MKKIFDPLFWAWNSCEVVNFSLCVRHKNEPEYKNSAVRIKIVSFIKWVLKTCFPRKLQSAVFQLSVSIEKSLFHSLFLKTYHYHVYNPLDTVNRNIKARTSKYPNIYSVTAKLKMVYCAYETSTFWVFADVYYWHFVVE